MGEMVCGRRSGSSPPWFPERSEPTLTFPDILPVADRRGGAPSDESGTKPGTGWSLIRLTRSGWLIAGTLSISTGLWVPGRLDEFAGGELWPWRGPWQLVMLWSAALGSLGILSVVRARALEPLFGGLDTAVRLHRKLGLAALLMLVAHVVLLVADAVVQGTSLVALLVPFWSGDQRSADILVFYALIGLGILAYDRRLRHERWLALHRVIGLLFLFGTLHAAIEPGTI